MRAQVFWYPMALMASLAGCGPNEADDAASSASEATEAVESAFLEAGFAFTAGDGLLGVGADRGSAAAAAAVRRAGQSFLPAGCATAAQDGSTARFLFRNCRNTLGVSAIYGALTVRYELTPEGRLRATLNALGLRAMGASLDLGATVTYGARESLITADVDTRTSGVGLRGLRLTRSGQYTLSWEPSTQCLGLDGTWATTVPSGTAETSLSDFRRCMGRCPQAGGRMTHRKLNGAVVSVQFVGGETAVWSISTGRAGTVALMCSN